jgi:DNA-binding NtrC family response regulator
MLDTLGHTVSMAETPEKALAICTGSGEVFDLLLSDVVMPQMSGKKLKTSIEVLQPKIKTLFMSGYTANVIAHHGILNRDINFLQKPFSMGDLSKKIREVISQ